jgi:4-amino-4-deoxy-L-arabinose transferase-like glycosyltransferase
VALLLLSPDFANNARRTMMEVPLTFWVVAALLVFLEALGRPRLALVLALPFGAAILTKSVLGLIVIPILFAAAAAAPALRKPLTGPWSWAGLAAGVALGASWSVHQYGLHGDRSLGEHFLSEIASRSAAGFDPLGAVLAYPEILLTRFEPVVIPGLIGAWCLWRTRPERGPAALLPVWVLVPVALYSLSAVRTARYVFPVFPALALCAGHWLCLAAPRLAGATTRFVAPGVAVLAAAAFWVRPDLLARSATAAFKADTALEARMPEGGGVPYLGTRYWELANPMLYYAERYLRPPSETPEEAVAATRRTAARILVVDDAARGPVEALARLEDVVRGPGWSAVYIGP